MSNPARMLRRQAAAGTQCAGIAQQGGQAKLEDIKNIDKAAGRCKGAAGRSEEPIGRKRDEIESRLLEPQARVHALRSFEAWRLKDGGPAN